MPGKNAGIRSEAGTASVTILLSIAGPLVLAMAVGMWGSAELKGPGPSFRPGSATLPLPSGPAAPKAQVFRV